MLPPETFELPVPELRYGYRSAIYFNRAKEIAAADPERDARGVIMQVFQKNHAILCGMDEAIAVLRVAVGRWENQRRAHDLFSEYLKFKRMSRAGVAQRHLGMHQLVRVEEEMDEEWHSEFEEMTVRCLQDGDQINPWEPVLELRGPYSSFAHLESVFLGVLARRTKVATNTAKVCAAANGKPVLFFADRFDHWATQGGDGYAAHVGGATGVASDAMAAWWGEEGMGTMPHALIAFYDGNTQAASEQFQYFYPDTNLVALVDFNNDCVSDALTCARHFGDELWGVRLDTSENLVDKCIFGGGQDIDGLPSDEVGWYKPTGVNPMLVERVREELDHEGFQHVKIIVSGGFNEQKITEFEALHVPVDSYAVGSSLLAGSNDFTADVVSPVAKFGRKYRPSERLQLVVP
jgi:nicotinate phosphoribosyltransferase